MNRIAEVFRAIIGSDGVLDTWADIDGYRGDLAVPRGGNILCVVRPRRTPELAQVVKHCAAHAIAITPRGGGTGLCGGATPAPGRDSVVVSFERMTTIRNLDPVGNTLVAEAGCTLHDIRAAAHAAGRLFAIDHGGVSSQIGGNLSTNAGGNNVLRYGMTRNQVLGLEVVLAGGEILSELDPLVKNNSGYDLKQIFVGSEGTLGLITAAALKLHPKPTKSVTVLVGLPNLGTVLGFLERTRTVLGDSVSAFELMTDSGIAFGLAHRGSSRWPFEWRAPWVVLIEADSPSAYFDLHGAVQALLEDALATGQVVDGALAASEAQRALFWSLRESIPVAMIETPGSLKSDTAVPVAALVEFVERARAAVDAVVPDCVPVPFGHVGDGNIHFNVLPPPGMPAERFAERHAELAVAIEDAAISLGGTISAEHGIGLIKRAALQRMKSPAALAAMRALKSSLDPANILNPGKVI
jgi:FAD/FMN-containing dehydrogenase